MQRSHLTRQPNIKTIPNKANLTLDGVDSLSESLDVVRCDTCNRDSAILGGVNRVLLGESGHLLWGQSGIGEHANLRGDVAPVVLAAESLEVLLEESTHLDDTVGHTFDLTKPLLVQGLVVEDGGSNASAVHWWVGVEWADDNLDLRVNAGLLLGVLGDNGESANTLTVETLNAR